MSQDDELYKEFILELYRNPLNKKNLAEFDIEQSGYNPACGDDINIKIKFDENKKIKDIGYQGQGCAISEAATSLLTDEVIGFGVQEIFNLKEEDVIKLLGVDIIYTRKKCALLGLKTLQEAIKKYE